MNEKTKNKINTHNTPQQRGYTDIYIYKYTENYMFLIRVKNFTLPHISYNQPTNPGNQARTQHTRCI